MGLMEVESVMIYMSIVTAGGLAKSACSLNIGSSQSYQLWSGIDRRFRGMIHLR